MNRNRTYGLVLSILLIFGVMTYTSVREPSTLLNSRTSQSDYQWLRSTVATREGLDTLRISGSGALYEKPLLNVMKEVDALPHEIYIIDLSGDASLFTNGLPCRWFNWAVTEKGIEPKYSKHKSPNALKENYIWIMRRLVYPHPSNTRLETEQQMVERLGYHYQKFIVNRKHIYPPETIDRFINFVHELPEGAWLHFHCLAGCSRTTSMMIIYDIMKNGDKLPLDTIIERQWALGGSNMNDTSVWFWGSWKKELLEMRKAMLEDFYRYRNDPEAYGKIAWSEWFAKNATAKEPV
jgi:hypothetical protein